MTPATRRLLWRWAELAQARRRGLSDEAGAMLALGEGGAASAASKEPAAVVAGMRQAAGLFPEEGAQTSSAPSVVMQPRAAAAFAAAMAAAGLDPAAMLTSMSRLSTPAELEQTGSGS